MKHKRILDYNVIRDIDNKSIFKPKIFVSFTTTSSRINYLKKVINSLLDQSLKPDEIFLFLSDGPYLKDKGVPSRRIPTSLRRREKKGEICIAYTKNIGPYRKLIPILKEQYKNKCVIITADDDTIYPYDWVETLYRSYLNYPQKVAAHRCKLMWFRDKKLALYEDWPVIMRNQEMQRDVQGEIRDKYKDLYLFPTGNSGVLYSPALVSDLIFDEIFLELAPTNDDIWFKFMTLINNIEVSCVKSRLVMNPDFRFAAGYKRNALTDINWSPIGRNNNRAIMNVINFLEHKKVLNIQQHLKN